MYSFLWIVASTLLPASTHVAVAPPTEDELCLYQVKTSLNHGWRREEDSSDDLSDESSADASEEQSALGVFGDMYVKSTMDYVKARLKLIPKEPAQRKPVMWLHIHKSAGTFMCRMANIHGERTPPTSTDRSFDQPFDWNCADRSLGDSSHLFIGGRAMQNFATLPVHSRCDQRTAHFARMNFTWGHIERELDEDDLCLEHFIYGTMLRNPIKTIESYVNFISLVEGYPEVPYQQWIRCVAEADATSCPNAEIGHQPFDNFIVRTLGGFDAMRLPPGGVNASHLERALEVLKRFHLVIPLEHMHSDRAKVQMHEMLGWHLEDDAETIRPLGRLNPHNIELTSDDIVDNLTYINRYDLELYGKYQALYEEHHLF